MSSVDTGQTSSVDAGRTYRGAGPRQRQDERRVKLVDAAVEVFGTTGYRSATVERICAAAGLTKRYFYESFESSETLLVAAYTRCIDELHASMVAGAVAGSPDDLDAMVRGGLEAFFGTIDADPRLARVAFFEVLGVSPEVDAVYQAAIQRFVDTLLALAETAFAGSALPPTDREALAEGIVGAVLMIAQHWVVANRTRPREAVIRSAHTIVTAVLDKVSR